MQVFRINCKSGKQYNIISETWENSANWGHKSTLISDYEIASNRVVYQNRTWECYRYQTCMSGLIATEIEKEQDKYITRYKEKHGIYNFKRGQKQQVIDEWCKTSYARDLLEIKERISTRNFD